MKFTCKIAVLTSIVLLAHFSSQARLQQSRGKTPTHFRIIGYLRDYDIADGAADKFNLSKITHLNIAFINPNSDGNFKPIKGLAKIVKAAHAKNVKVLASLGGGLAPAYYTSLLTNDNRSGFIKKLVQVAVSNHLDGIDVDLEGERIDQNYEAFIIELSAALKQNKKLITAAVATYYQSQYTDKALAKLDFINIMSYDKTGPWKPNKPGPHAPYSMAVTDLDYFTNTRAIPKEKLNLGVPFYGYGFGKNIPTEITYAELLKRYVGSKNKDTVATDGGVIYYNAVQTIKDKTDLALQKAGGMMIWQLLQDAGGKESLLDAIHATIRSKAKP